MRNLGLLLAGVVAISAGAAEWPVLRTYEGVDIDKLCPPKPETAIRDGRVLAGGEGAQSLRGAPALGPRTARSSAEARFTRRNENCYTTNRTQESTCQTMLRDECCVGYWKAGLFKL